MKRTNMSIPSAIVILGLMALLTASLASADSATFSASQDSYIREASYQQDRNYGSDEELVVNSYVDKDKRTLAQFDVSSIPSGAVIDSATLHLYMYDAPSNTPYNNRTHEVHRLTNSWVEGTGYQIGVPSDGVTWTNRSTGVTWTTHGGDYDSTVTDNTTTGTTDGVWLTWDVASDVQMFVGGVDNYGWLIRDEQESSSTQYEAWFRSREYTTATYRPKLEVQWHDAPSVNLTVERIDPKYVIENMTNVMMVCVKNTGTLSSYTGNVSLEIRNSGGVIYEAKNTTNLTAPAATSVEVRFAWKPTTLENVTLIATVDCDNDIAEANEADNSLADNRNTTGNCTADTLVAEACYGYQGQHPMDTVLEYKDKLGVIYTTGNYHYGQDSVEFRIGGTYPNTNLITGGSAVIPTGAEVVMARLYVYYTWRDFDLYGYPDLGMQFWDQAHAAQYPAEDVNYTDWKGFTDSPHYMYGTVAYDVTDHVPGNSGAHPYQADITQFYWGSGTYGKTSGMALLIVYKDNSLPYVECYVDEGCDRLATRYLNTIEGRWEYYVTPEDATTEAEFPNIGNPPVGILNASLFTITIDALDGNTGYSTEETLGFNGNYWQGAWSNGGYSGSTYPIGYDTADVESELQDNPAGLPELAEFQERYSTPKNGFSAANAILMVETKPCLGICYSGTVCNGSVVAINLTCGECINAGLGDSWENYEFESPCSPGYMVPRLCYDYCPECCDGINNFDGDGFTDWPDDPECACCLDGTEDLDEGCPTPCVPELATFALVGCGLAMVVGLVRFRREG